ncbi:alpha-L-fucosidase [Globicatella sanguinis]|uniref:alpha-L-fucosidase n=1 Tax=Globicatella sanguinis TaxID=13076 RepID=UPI0025427B3E|nr:alpha-L-fucosidase [Globicatella sanguinis]MDK7630911.1 alpha-L-fucosidase [Globicatella sanguinis]WIK66174.1 alpha-L-fucosidase [Globicatella sanguinis]WKT55579.1 alpha-L-fucosidase [Globicatella sanguinis]
MSDLVRGDIVQGKGTNELDMSQYPESKWLPQKLEWFQDQKLGFLIHWGLYSQAGIVESWQLSEKDEWAREPKAWRESIGQLKLDYWNLIGEFNPTEFNADEWMSLLSDCGFKYGIVTSKHHDGFNLFNTLYSEFKICGKQSPCKIDLYREIMTAIRRHHMAAGVYYSKADWYSPYYWLDDDEIKGRHVSYDTTQYPEIWQRYVDFVHRQIEELTTHYGKIDLLWLDAGWCGEGKEDLQMDLIAEIARKHQPELIMVNRAMGGRHENYVTPERKIPDYHQIPTKPWESNVPIGNDWGYVPDDTIKSGDELIRTMVEIISKGGNVLFGVGPTPKGTLLAEEVQSLKRLGDWMKIYSEGIYGTRALKHYQPNGLYFLTQKDHAINLFIDKARCNQKMALDVLLPSELVSSVQDVQSFSDGKTIEWDAHHITIPDDEAQFPIYGCKIILNKK